MRYVLLLTVALLFSMGAWAEGAPAWKMAIKLGDGRMFVTDGSMTVDAALVKPKAMPRQVLEGGPAAALIEKSFAAKPEVEVAAAQLQKRGTHYVAPNGLHLSAVYVEYLAGTLDGDLRLRLRDDLDPVVIVLDGKPVGLVMPMARAK